MLRLATTLAAVFCVTAAAAQAPGPVPYGTPRGPALPGGEPSAYCRAAAQALFQGGGDAEIAMVSRNCRRGDTIAIATAAQGAVFQVGRLCDFTKAIVTMGPQVVCVLGAERAVR